MSVIYSPVEASKLCSLQDTYHGPNSFLPLQTQHPLEHSTRHNGVLLDVEILRMLMFPLNGWRVASKSRSKELP
jgi:hypothetical protein